MGLIGKVLKHVISDFILITNNVLAPKFDIESRYAGTPGIVGIPLKDDSCIIVQISEDLSKTVFIGTIQNQDINEGEVLVYSRDSNGNLKAKVYCDKDGNVVINDDTDNAVRFSKLKEAYDQLKSDFDNFVNITYNLHNHPTAPVGPVSVPSVTGSSSTGNIDPAKIDNVKVP